MDFLIELKPNCNKKKILQTVERKARETLKTPK